MSIKSEALSLSHLGHADDMQPSKIITRTIISGKGLKIPFFVSQEYKDFLYYCETNLVDRSVSFHKDGTTMYVIEIVNDANYVEHETKWNHVVLAEMSRWSELRVHVSSGVQDALDFN